jgi:hypothetical protein
MKPTFRNQTPNFGREIPLAILLASLERGLIYTTRKINKEKNDQTKGF